MEKIGIFGGSFNPVHNGHLKIAKSFISDLKLDSLLLIPAAVSPFKTGKEIYIPEAACRVRMLELCTALFPGYVIDIETYEIDKGGISYTADTIKFLKEKYPGAELFLLIGGDHPKTFRKWKKWEYIVSNTNLCIINRPGYISEEEKNSIINDLSTDKTSPVFLNSPMINISSSKIREIIKKSGTINGLVPDGVEKYIHEKGLYR